MASGADSNGFESRSEENHQRDPASNCSEREENHLRVRIAELPSAETSTGTHLSNSLNDEQLGIITIAREKFGSDGAGFEILMNSINLTHDAAVSALTPVFTGYPDLILRFNKAFPPDPLNMIPVPINRPLNLVDDMVPFLEAVRAILADEEKVHRFRMAFDAFLMQRPDFNTAVNGVLVLLMGHEDLLNWFQRFLPLGYEFQDTA